MLYIHIPFCVRKCDYCDFLSFPASKCGNNREEQTMTYKKYIDALIKDIEVSSSEFKDRAITSIFIGGGTPSILPINEMDRLFKALHNHFAFAKEIEFTVECNPGTLTEEKLFCYKNSGVNRLSIGLQSANDNELKRLGRIHNYQEFVANYKLARQIGFNNINVDLISAIPDQTLLSFENSLNKVISLNPEHISCYGLILEEGTAFYELSEEELNIPSENIEREIYYKARNILEANGYYQYEISNYSKEGFQCKHNVGYWDRREYLGLGLGASSLIGSARFKRTDKLMDYCAGDFEKYDFEDLTKDDEMSEYMFLGLRKTCGISSKTFEKKFGTSIMNVYGHWTEKMLKDDLLETYTRKDIGDTYYRLTNKGMDVANYVMAGYV